MSIFINQYEMNCSCLYSYILDLDLNWCLLLMLSLVSIEMLVESVLWEMARDSWCNSVFDFYMFYVKHETQLQMNWEWKVDLWMWIFYVNKTWLYVLQNYVTCALGIHYVGFVMICFGAVNSLSSYLFGKLAQYTGRITLFCLGESVKSNWPEVS